MGNYNAILILEAIAAAPIPDDIKLMAVKDINRMYQDKKYGELVWIGELSQVFFDKPALTVHHLWDKSELGSDFWIKMHQILIS